MESCFYESISDINKSMIVSALLHPAKRNLTNSLIQSFYPALKHGEFPKTLVFLDIKLSINNKGLSNSVLDTPPIQKT